MTTGKLVLDSLVLKPAKAASRLRTEHHHEFSIAKVDAGSTTRSVGSSNITLSNEIHPVVGEDRLTNGIEPEVVADAMRLTTRFLTAPACLSFMHTVFFGEKAPIEKGLYRKDWMLSFELRGDSGELTDEQIKMTMHALERFALAIVIGLCDSENDGKTEYPRTMGWGASILFSRKDYEDLEQAKAEGRWDDHAWLTMHIAMTLVHELGHAVCMVTHDQGHYYFQGSSVSEEGFELCNRLFGGSMYPMPRGNG